MDYFVCVIDRLDPHFYAVASRGGYSLKQFFLNVLSWIKSFFSALSKTQPLPAPEVPKGEDYPWVKLAKGEVGQLEIPGSKDNPRIVAYHSTTTLKASSDDVPWCSSFINWLFFKLTWKRTNSAAARSWLNWGIKLARPIPGCIVIFARGTGGHVAIYESGYTSGFINVLGGNQSNTVKHSSYSESKVLGYRWPSEYPLPAGAKVLK